MAELVLIAALAVLPLLIFYTVIHLSGPAWDMGVRILQGRAFLNFFSHRVSLQAAFGGEAYQGANNLLYYFEPYREPLEIPIFAFLQLFFNRPALPYMILVYALYLLALNKLAKTIKADRLILFALMTNSYIAYFLFIPNGGEALSVVLAIVGLAYLLEEKARSGLFFGLASLAKYPSICLFPLVLLIPDRKKMLTALALEILMVLLWGVVVDYSVYGIPFYSYLVSLGAANVVSGASPIALSALINVFAYPAFFLAVAGALLLVFKKKISLKLDYRAKVLLGFAALSLLCYVAILPHNDPFTQARYGYLAATSLLVLAAVALSKAAAPNHVIRYAVAILSVGLLLYAVWLSYASNSNPTSSYYNFDSANGIYINGGSELATLGFSGCRFISNAWVPMIYSGYPAYSPFVLYAGNSTVQILEQTAARLGPGVKGIILDVSKNQFAVTNATYREQEARYPILVFSYTGVAQSFILNLNSSRLAYFGQNFSVYLPQNVTCYNP
jgi:hypothetical protein